MKVTELIKILRSQDDLYSIYDAEELIYNQAKCVAHGLFLDRHRWYDISTNVYECDDGYVGVTGTSDLKSEVNTYSDIGILCTAEEYVRVPSFTFKPKSGEI